MRKGLLLCMLLPVLVPAQADTIAPDESGMRSVTSFELSKEMIPGWNVGNSLEATDGETSWGNPLITQRLMDSVKAAGFRSVRIPVAWSKFTDAATYTIDPVFKARVGEVVDYVLNSGMYAIINIHWDGGWIQPTNAKKDAVTTQLAAMWKQIAVYFRDYGDKLLFAGTNEVMVENDWSAPKEEYYTVQNGYNQTFVSTVRATGGRNTYRYLVVQGFNTNIDHAINYMQIPTDPTTSKRLLIEVHYYDPYNFTINTGNMTVVQWGKNATDPDKMESWAHESWADGQFEKMKTIFISKEFGVVIGEYGVIARLSLGAEYAEYRRYYIEYVTKAMVDRGLIPYYWDNGGTGEKGLGIFNRTTGAQAYPDIIAAIMKSRPFVGIHESSRRSLQRNGFSVRQSGSVIQCTNPNSRESQASLYTAAGALVKTFSLSPGVTTLDIETLVPGCYLLNVSRESGFGTKRIVKE